MSKLEVRIFDHQAARSGELRSLDWVAYQIKEGTNALKKQTQAVRKATDEATRKAVKGRMMRACFSAVLPPHSRKVSDAKGHTGLICFDIDRKDVSDSRLAEIKEIAKISKYVRLAFTSVSGGYKIVLPVTPIPSIETHKAVFGALAKQTTLEDVIDWQGEFLTMTQNLSHDPDVIFNPDSMPIEVKVAASSVKPAKAVQKPAQAIDVSILDKIDADDYGTWLKVGMALHHAEQPISVFDKWSQKSPKYDADAVQSTWASFNREKPEVITWKSIEALVKPKPAKWNPNQVAEDVLSKKHIFSVASETRPLIYEKGVYRPDTTFMIEKEIIKVIGNNYRPRQVREVLDCVKWKTAIETDWTHPGIINCQNGLYNIETGKLTAHTASLLSRVQIPTPYDAKAQCPEIIAFLKDVLEDRLDDERLCYQFIGYCLHQATPIAKMAVCVGPTHTGKSTFLDIVRALIGRENISNVNLQDLDDSALRFARSGLDGKLVNIASDVSRKLLAGDSNILKITAGDEFTVEKKHCPSYELRPYAKLLCATNEMPRSRDTSDAWMSRLILIPFRKQHIENAKRNYLETLTAPQELSGLLTQAINGLSTILSTGQFTTTQSTAEASQEYLLENNPIIEYLDGWQVSETRHVSENQVYADYCAWCETEKLKEAPKTRLRKTIETHLKIGRQRIREDGQRVYVYKLEPKAEGSE